MNKTYFIGILFLLNLSGSLASMPSLHISDNAFSTAFTREYFLNDDDSLLVLKQDATGGSSVNKKPEVIFKTRIDSGSSVRLHHLIDALKLDSANQFFGLQPRSRKPLPKEKTLRIMFVDISRGGKEYHIQLFHYYHSMLAPVFDALDLSLPSELKMNYKKRPLEKKL